MDKETAYRNALMWAFERLSTDGVTANEIRRTAEELGNVLRGNSSPASAYGPEVWEERNILTERS